MLISSLGMMVMMKLTAKGGDDTIKGGLGNDFII